jgi:hypothetical protein
VMGKFGAQRGLIKQLLNILGLLQPFRAERSNRQR